MALRVTIAALYLQQAHMYATKLTTSDCGLALSVGETIMYSTAVSSTARTVYFEDSTGSAVSCGGAYTAGETYTAQISSTNDQFVLEVSGGTFNRWVLSSQVVRVTRG